MPHCPICLANHPTYLDFCPTERAYEFKSKVSLPKKDFDGQAPSLFVGRYGYPNVRIGLLANETIPKHAESPRTWATKNLPIQHIAEMRSSLVNSYNPLHIKSFSNRITETLQHTAQAKTPTDIEVKLSKTPQFNISFDSDRLPHGPSIELKQANTTANPKIPKAVEKAVADTSLKSAPAINTLYQKGLEESYLTRILSSGSLGIGKNRKFVPTRWAITATDDTLAKNLLKEVKHYPLADHLLYRGGGWGNHYYILFFPRLFSYELFETLVRTGNYSTDYESYKGRTTYAKETVGGYYAARLPIIDKLKKIQKQASVLVLRFITDDYWMPLGVWVCREATRKTLVNKPLHFSDPKQMISHITQEIQKKFKININQHLNQSKLLQSLTQRQLSDY